MDLSDFLSMIRSSGSFATSDDTMLTTFVNEACLDFRRDAQVVMSEASLTLTDGQSVYDMTDLELNGIITIKSITGSGSSTSQSRPLTIIDYDRFAQINTNSTSTTGDPLYFIPLGVNKFKIYPEPQNSTTTIQAIIVPKPDPLVLTTDIPDENDSHHMTIFYRSMQLALEYDRQPNDEIQLFEKRYMEGVSNARSMFNRLTGSSSAPLRPSSSYRRGGYSGIYDRRVVGNN